MSHRKTYIFGDLLHPESKLTFICDSATRLKERKGFFLCECGNITQSTIQNVKRGASKSCGCVKDKNAADRFRSHGLRDHPMYHTWNSMMQRCFNPKNTAYCYYGGAGITVCDRWADKHTGISNFIEDMGPRPAGLTLDRVDVKGSYCKENCRWVDMSHQGFNRGIQKNNTSGVTGVEWKSRRGKWAASIKKNGEYISLGYFENFDDAVEKRREAELKYFGYNLNR